MAVGVSADTCEKPRHAAASPPIGAYLDRGTRFEGVARFPQAVRIDGAFVGEIASDHTLVIGESADVEASVTGRRVTIAGQIRGDVVATDVVILLPTAIVDGDIQAAGLRVSEGAVVNGTLRIGA